MTRITGRSLVLAGLVATLLVGVGCGAGLGSLERQEIDLAIQEAQLSVEAAQRAELALSARPALSTAEAKLSEARRALEQEDGVAALKAANEARLEAQHALTLDAQSDAYQKLIEEETQRQRDMRAELAQAQNEAATARSAALEIQMEIQSLKESLAEIRRETEAARSDKEFAETRATALADQLDMSRRQIDDLVGLLDEAREEQSDASRRVEELRGQIDAAQRAIETAETKAREAESAKSEAKRVAEAYSASMSGLDNEKRREEALAKARAQNRPPAPTVSTGEIRSATPQVRSWKSAWESDNLTGHLSHYAADATGERIVVREGRETKTTWSRSQLIAAIEATQLSEWDAVARATVRGEGAFVVAEAPYRRKVSSSEAAAFWVRKAFWSMRAADWRIVKEEWRFYDEAPTFR